LQYLNGNESIIEIAKDIGVTDPIVSDWVCRYQKIGVEAFLKSNTIYSADYKMNVLNYMNETGTSSIDTAALLRKVCLVRAIVWTTQSSKIPLAY